MWLWAEKEEERQQTADTSAVVVAVAAAKVTGGDTGLVWYGSSIVAIEGKRHPKHMGSWYNEKMKPTKPHTDFVQLNEFMVLCTRVGSNLEHTKHDEPQRSTMREKKIKWSDEFQLLKKREINK